MKTLTDYQIWWSGLSVQVRELINIVVPSYIEKAGEHYTLEETYILFKDSIK